MRPVLAGSGKSRTSIQNIRRPPTAVFHRRKGLISLNEVVMLFVDIMMVFSLFREEWRDVARGGEIGGLGGGVDRNRIY